MEPQQIEGRSIDEAIENACRIFGVTREKLNIEIISEGSNGFLGLGAKKAVIKASLLDINMDLQNPILEMAQELSPPSSTPQSPPAGAGPDRQPPEDAAPQGAAEADQKASEAREFLEGLLKRMQIKAQVTVNQTEESIILDIRGDGSGLLIGKRGQNLDAIQYLVNKAVHRSANGQKMIIVDTEDYRKRREEALVAMAMKLAEKVKKTKKPVTVGHMNAHDRRIIHLAMRGDEEVTTKSRGEGEYRKILILPAHRGHEWDGTEQEGA